MEADQLINFLATSPLISREKATEIASHFEGVILAKNSFAVNEQQVPQYYYFLEEGVMRAFAYDTEGQEVTTAFYATGDVVFEVSSFFNRTKSVENIQALTNCTVWRLSYEELNGLFHALPEFREFGRAMLVRGFAALKNRMLSMITETAEQRYARLLQTNPQIFQHAPLKMIASYLGVTDSSLSRIRREFLR
jgi:CRP-like cAMP-binding protein